jgi:hypothetical protein
MKHAVAGLVFVLTLIVCIGDVDACHRRHRCGSDCAMPVFCAPCCQGAVLAVPPGSAGTREANRGGTYYGCDLRFGTDGLAYWYSNSNSSTYCDTSYTWHVGASYVTYQNLGTCPNGLVYSVIYVK